MIWMIARRMVHLIVAVGLWSLTTGATANEQVVFPGQVGGPPLDLDAESLSRLHSDRGSGQRLVLGGLTVEQAEGPCVSLAGRWEGYLEGTPVAGDIKNVMYITRIDETEASVVFVMGADLNRPFFAWTSRFKHDGQCVFQSTAEGRSSRGSETGIVRFWYDGVSKTLRQEGRFSFTAHAALTRSESLTVYSEKMATIFERVGIESGQFENIVPTHLGNGYLMYSPANANKEEKKPLIFFLHGIGDIGDSPEILYKASPLRYIVDGGSVDAFILAPQLRTMPSGAVSLDWLNSILRAAMQKWPIDPDRVYLVGLSLGAYQAWHWAIQKPDTFAALVSVAASDPEFNPQMALDGMLSFGKYSQLKGMKIRAYHGDHDKIMPIDSARKTWKRATQAGAKLEATIYSEADHDAWSRTFADPAFFSWLLTQRRGK